MTLSPFTVLVLTPGCLTSLAPIHRSFRMSHYALADGNEMFDAINYQVVCKRLHFLSMNMKCDVERTALSRGYSIAPLREVRQVIAGNSEWTLDHSH
jgi:hypothetical protein